MPFDLDPFIEELRGFIAATWGDVTVVLDVEQATRLTWADLAEDLPYAVLLTNRLTPGDWGLANLAYEVSTELYYVAETKGLADGLRAKAMSMINALWPVPAGSEPLVEAQVLELPAADWSDEIIPNQVFTAANRAQRAVRISVKFLAGISP